MFVLPNLRRVKYTLPPWLGIGWSCFLQSCMAKKRTRTVEELFGLALKVEADRRRAFLVEACAGDSELLREAESLISAHEDAGGFLERSLDAEAISVMMNQADEIPSRLQPGDKFAKYKIVRLIARS